MDAHLQISQMHPPYTHLVPIVRDVDPDDVFSSVPYEKGSSLLMYLEQTLGGPGNIIQIKLFDAINRT